MRQNDDASRSPDEGLVAWTHVIYGLHSLSVLIGITSAATIVGAFVFGVPSIVAVVLNYLKRGEAAGTYLESHFRWQIRTFWFAVLWCLIGVLLMATLVGIPVAIVVLISAGVWVVYRVVRGWLALKEGKPLPVAS